MTISALDLVCTVTCRRCAKMQVFRGETSSKCIAEAKGLGWSIDIVANTKVCPDCNSKPVDPKKIRHVMPSSAG